MSKNTAVKPASATQTISQLLEISKLDTLYRDLYLQRADELMEDLLTRSAYTQIKTSIASLGLVEQQLRSAVERGDWVRSRELTERVRTLKGSAATMGDTIRLAEALYDGAADIPIDPFSPGLSVFVGGSQKLREFQEQAVRILSTLERSDSSRKALYSGRAADLKSVSLQTSTEQVQEKKAEVGPAELQQQALTALESGDLSRLDQLVQKLMDKPAEKEGKQETGGVNLGEAAELGDDLLYSFGETTLAGAAKLGLAPTRTRSRRQFAYLIPHGWQPAFLKDEMKQWSKGQLAQLAYPTGTGDQARDAIEFYLLNPFITSGGTRFQVCLVIEDLLIEDFAEPEPKQEMPESQLLVALGLKSRWGLSRTDIEKAVLQHGPRIIKEQLGLDPEAFKVVAIPPDIFTLFAPERGWGQKEMWTHFDGYRVRDDGKLHALAGGDKRFGGSHDLVSFNPEFARETLLTRFAVVQRKRMMTWHHKRA